MYVYIYYIYNIPSYPQDLPIETPDFRRHGGTSTHGLHAANAGHQDPTVLGGDLEKENAGSTSWEDQNTWKLLGINMLIHELTTSQPI